MSIGEKLREAFELIQNRSLSDAYFKFLEVNSSILFSIINSLTISSDPEYYALLFDLSEQCLSKCFEILPKLMYRSNFMPYNLNIAIDFALTDHSSKFGLLDIPSSILSKILIDLEYNILLIAVKSTSMDGKYLKIPMNLDELTQLGNDCRLYKNLIIRRNALQNFSAQLLKNSVESYEAYKLAETFEMLDRIVFCSKNVKITKDWCDYLRGISFNLVESGVTAEYLSDICYAFFRSGNYNLGINFLEGLCHSQTFRSYLSENSSKSEKVNLLLRHCDLIGCKDADAYKSYSKSKTVILPSYLKNFNVGTDPESLKLNTSSCYLSNAPEHLILNLICAIKYDLEETRNTKLPINLPTPYLEDNEPKFTNSDHFSYEVLQKSIAPHI